MTSQLDKLSKWFNYACIARQYTLFARNGPCNAIIHHLLVCRGDQGWRSVGSYIGMQFKAKMLIRCVLCTVAMETQKWERLGLQSVTLIFSPTAAHYTSFIITRLVFIPQACINCIRHSLLTSCFKERKRRTTVRVQVGVQVGRDEVPHALA